MYKVNNKKCIRNIGTKSFRANRTRNIIAIIAIALTCMLFTSAFTLISIFVESYQESNFRQVGGNSHGSIKNVTYEEIEDLKSHPLIEEYGTTQFIGSLTGDVFSKKPTEIKYIDEVYARHSYVDFIEGQLPAEGTLEMACSTKVLESLGIDSEIGIEVPLTFQYGNTIIEETFILSGYFDTDEVIGTSFVFIPRTYADEVVASHASSSETYGQINMELFLTRSSSIEDDIVTILTDNGFQTTDSSGSNFKDYGVNWGYISSQFSSVSDPLTILFGVVLFFIFAFTGYLIIYNVFRISVTTDIRFYGLLKTIGTTTKQLRQLVYRQAYQLALIGIPLGLLLGYLLGCVLAPITVSNFAVTTIAYTINPYIFLGGGLFSLITLMISCSIPAKIASRVSPIEAIRFTDATSKSKTSHHKTKRITPLRMALANMKRFRGKAILVVLSLTLATLILQMTLQFTNGFDMNLYLKKFSATDFLVSNTNYFNYTPLSNLTTYVDVDLLNTLESIDSTDSGVTYLNETSMKTYSNIYVDEDYLFHHWNQFSSPSSDDFTQSLENYQKTEDGLYLYHIDLFGVDDIVLDNATTLEGDLGKLEETDGNYIAAVVHTNDYDIPQKNENTPEIGDIITLRHVRDAKYVNLETNEEYTTYEELETTTAEVAEVIIDEITINYEVAALVTLPTPLTNRSFGVDKFLLPSDRYLEDTGNNFALYYTFNVENSKFEETNDLLTTLTDTPFSDSDFESRSTITEEFESFRNMFLIVGTFLSFIVGFIGILNFFNVILTSIHMRRREFAMLQSMGMTGRQLKSMLVFEGLLYIGIATIVVAILGLFTLPMFSQVMESGFWFYNDNPTYLPLIIVAIILSIIGIITPLAIYKGFHKQSIVERLRQVE